MVLDYLFLILFVCTLNACVCMLPWVQVSIETAEVRASGAGVKAMVSYPQVLRIKLPSFARQYVILTTEPSLEPQHYNFN